jgi:anti-sigma regulatory factor (Ser/Thr protein kinase)
VLHRGRGLALMHALMDSVDLSHGDGGTRVRMERVLSDRPVATPS